MPASRLIGTISFGGSAVNNPPDYNWTDYSDYPGLDPKKAYVRMNITFFDEDLGVNLQVTGLVVLNDSGFPLMSANDLVYLPCPPKCA